MKDDAPKKQYSDEVPPAPTPGDPGREARERQKIERQRAAERDLSVQEDNEQGSSAP